MCRPGRGTSSGAPRCSHPLRTLLAAVLRGGDTLSPENIVGVVGAVPLLVRSSGHAVQVRAVGAVVATWGGCASRGITPRAASRFCGSCWLIGLGPSSTQVLSNV